MMGFSKDPAFYSFFEVNHLLELFRETVPDSMDQVSGQPAFFRQNKKPDQKKNDALENGKKKPDNAQQDKTPAQDVNHHPFDQDHHREPKNPPDPVWPKAILPGERRNPKFPIGGSW